MKGQYMIATGTPPIDILRIRQIVESVWCYETSYCDNPGTYIANDPAYYQCKVTTAWIFGLLPVFEGQIMKGMVDGREHTWIRINGIDVDLTWRQFPAGSKLTGVEIGYLSELVPEDNKWMKDRYSFFKKRCDALLKRKKQRIWTR